MVSSLRSEAVPAIVWVRQDRPGWAASAGPALVVAADEAKEELDEAEAAWWFCEKGAPADGMPHNVVLFSGTGSARRERTV